MTVTPGRPHPLGATVEPAGVKFSVYSKHADRLELLLYDAVDAPEPSRVIELTGDRFRTNDYWHVRVPGIRPGQRYAYRAHGPFAPTLGHRFDPGKVLLDPYARAIDVPTGYDRYCGVRPGRNDRTAMKGVVIDIDDYDWEGDAPLRRPFSQTVIYEMHVRGFTRHPSSGVPESRRGTFAGLVDKIPYLVDLGITTVELMPIFAFDPLDAPKGRVNYWGYAPVSFFAPHPLYSSAGGPRGPIDEFRDTIKAFHRAGIEVILDVVYNHTAEGDDRGPTFSLRGLDNRDYYFLDPSGAYANYSGTGNTLNANRSAVRRLIIDSLHYWVEKMHVDGFRFDLASILARDEGGQTLPRPPLLWDIESDPVLAGTKLIAEAWDSAGLYQVGTFIGDFWKEWNGQFRDDVRSFVRGDEGMVQRLVHRVLGSPDLYGHEHREPEQSINFVAAHDGFTLNDLVSYDQKHNAANGENNRDGANDNRSWNHGVEGPTDDPEIEALRNRQVKNLLALTFLSLGAPMILSGDEVRRTQKGNNNAYCQDNELTWLDWSLTERHGDVLRFVRELIGLRSLRDAVRSGERISLAEIRERANVKVHGVRLDQPDFSHHSQSVAISATSLSGHIHMYFAANAYWKPLEFQLPPPPGPPWRRVLDTSLLSPDDVRPMTEAPLWKQLSYPVHPRTVIALFAPGQ